MNMTGNDGCGMVDSTSALSGVSNTALRSETPERTVQKQGA